LATIAAPFGHIGNTAQALFAYKNNAFLPISLADWNVITNFAIDIYAESRQKQARFASANYINRGATAST